MYSLKVQLVSDDEIRSTLLEKRTDSAMVIIVVILAYQWTLFNLSGYRG